MRFSAHRSKRVDGYGAVLAGASAETASSTSFPIIGSILRLWMRAPVRLHPTFPFQGTLLLPVPAVQAQHLSATVTLELPCEKRPVHAARMTVFGTSFPAAGQRALCRLQRRRANHQVFNDIRWPRKMADVVLRLPPALAVLTTEDIDDSRSSPCLTTVSVQTRAQRAHDPDSRHR